MISLGVMLARKSSFPVNALLRSLLPPGALLLALAWMHQTQNVDYRLEAPAFLALSYAAICLVNEPRHSSRQRWSLVAVLLLVSVLVAGLGIHKLGRAARFTKEIECYMAGFAPRAGGHLEAKDRVALTEAGRLPFWSNAQVLDAVGLNSPETAREPVSEALLERFAPDLVMFHHAGALRLAGSTPGARARTLSADELKSAVVPVARKYFNASPPSFEGVDLSSEQLAAVALSHYLWKHGERFHIVVVDFGEPGSFSHVYGFRRGWHRLERIEAMLRRSAREDSSPGKYGYFFVRKLAREEGNHFSE